MDSVKMHPPRMDANRKASHEVLTSAGKLVSLAALKHMKNLLQNLLIGFAIALCALIAMQWVREAHMHEKVQQLTNKIQDKTEAIQSLEGQVKRSEAEVQRLDLVKSELTDIVKSNRLDIAALRDRKSVV